MKWSKISEENLSIVVVMCFTLFLSSIFICKYKTKNVAINKGLEQCPVKIGSHDTIWVKNCGKYLKTLKHLNSKL